MCRLTSANRYNLKFNVLTLGKEKVFLLINQKKNKLMSDIIVLINAYQQADPLNVTAQKFAYEMLNFIGETKRSYPIE